MFLAWNEIKHSKLKYILVIGVMFLISYLVFFLTGLAYGLAQSNRAAIDKWDADAIILSEDSNSVLGMSFLTLDNMEDVTAEEKASLIKSNVVVVPEDEMAEKINASILAIQADEFLVPNITEGNLFVNDNEVVVNDSFKTQYGYEIGDTLEMTDSDEILTITGFTDNAELTVSPVIYMSNQDYTENIQPFGMQNSEERINAIVLRAKDHDIKNIAVNNDELQLFSIGEFVRDLPGYQAQVLTFGIMIGFLIVISAVVIGIFIYVLTMQKRNVFGVLKAQGIQNSVLSLSVFSQTFILAIIGVGAGFLLTVITSLVLPVTVPFENNFLFYVIAAALIVVFALVGAFSSVLSITKINPLEAMKD